MLHKTKGIFLQKINYSETSLIVKIYTGKFGIQSFLIKGARRKKTKLPANVLQHLALLDLEMYYRENANLQKLKELSLLRHFMEIPYNIQKSAIAMFINEVLQKSIREQESNPPLFDFIENSVVFLDETSAKVQNFHLIFMTNLTRYLGFYPQNNYSSKNPYFDMMEGAFFSSMNHAYMMDEWQSKYLNQLLYLSFDNMKELQLSQPHRIQMLEKLIEYYALHLPGFSNIKSLGILKEVFNGSK